MANTIVKAAAIVRAGYEYQDLIGIETLIRYFRDPDLYDWIWLEAVDSPYGALDDLVAARTDGSFELTQVKFTVDEGANLLEWDWLLNKRPKGTSMLAKWAKSLANVRLLGKVYSAELRTNRLPSADFAAAMNGDFVEITRLDADLRRTIERECGGGAEAEAFFGMFAFRSGERNLDAFEHAIRSELVPSHLDPNGWSFFRDQVRRWAMRRTEPFPDGRITHKHLLQVIARRRSEPIRQDFRVPSDYQVPSGSFDATFRSRISNVKTPLTILWGTPGRGKSTYLSFLIDELRKAGTAVIRHHYFLSAEDTADRMSFFEISNSLVSQLIDHFPKSVVAAGDDYRNLRKIIERAANHLAQQRSRLYLVIDGLDHVWRDTRKVDQLNFLFNKLLPLPAGVSLIIGTQRVDMNWLPSRLVSAATSDDWIEIPAMDQVAVHRWVQIWAGRLAIVGDPAGPRRQEQLHEIGEAFFDVSHGHPLHLIYAFESLTRSGHPIRSEDVENLPPCPDGDIRTYYATLWNNLDNNARHVLHMLSGSDFYWPSLGVRQCIGTFDDVAFLLEHRSSGLVPFHESIFAYVRERDDHSEAFEALLPRVVKWLEGDAPPFWRWGWLWLCQARLGDASRLMDGVSRDWAVDSLAEGWPERQAIKILAAAEAHSFADGDLPRTVELRSIKTRLMNARDFQIQSYADFEEVSIASAGNVQQLRNLADALPALTDDEVLMLARAAPDEIKDEIVAACVDEYARRINVWIELRHRADNEFVALTYLLLDAAVLGQNPDVKRLLRILKVFKNPKRYVLYLAKRLGEAGHVDALLALRALLKAPAWKAERDAIDDDVLRACCLIAADPSTRLIAMKQPTSALCASWLKLHTPEVSLSLQLAAVPENLLSERYEYGIDISLRDFFREVFFSALADALTAQGDYEFCYPNLPREGLGWIRVAIETLEGTARMIAGGTLKPSFSTPFLGAADVGDVAFGRRATESAAAQYRSFTAALRMIALDLHLIGLAPGMSPAVGKDEFEIARGSTHWSDEVWIERALEIRTPVMTNEAASALLLDEIGRLSASITEFNERAGQWVKLARFGVRHKLDGVTGLVRRAANCLLGYGWRKDVWVFDVLDAVRDVHDLAATPALEWIKTLVPIIDKITEFTDGSETTYAESELIKLIAHCYPDRLPLLFKAHIDRDEWKYADDCLKFFVGVADFADTAASSLISTFLDRRTLDALETASKTDTAAAALLERQFKFLGGKPPDHQHRGTSTRYPGRKKRRPDPTRRGPDQFEKLVNDADHEDAAARVGVWLEHWKNQGRGAEALNSIRDYLKRQEINLNAGEVLDQAFQMSLAIEGREQAFFFLVEAHIRRHGWHSNWTSSSEVMQRLRWASDHYPDRWMDFIRDSSQPESYFKKLGYGFSIWHKYLVRFLLMVGQRSVAANIVDAFARTIVAEVDDQPIPDAPWFR